MNSMDWDSIPELKMACEEGKMLIEVINESLNEQQIKDIDRMASEAERMLVNNHLLSSHQLLCVANLLIIWAIEGRIGILERHAEKEKAG